MKILVTGADGYIGSALTETLVKNASNYQNVEIVALDIKRETLGYMPSWKRRVLTYVKHDLCSNDDFPYNDFDVIFPLAGIVGQAKCDARPDEAEKVNYKAIVDMVECLKRHQSSTKIIFPNTNSGYGHTDGEEVCTEEHSLNPISLYGQTKVKAENYIRENWNNYVVYRLATVFGMSSQMRWGLLVNNFVSEWCDLFCFPERNFTTILYEPHFKRNFIDIEDVIRAFLYAINPNIQGVFNLGDDRLNCTKQELWEKIDNYAREYLKRKYGIDCPDFQVKISDEKDPDQRNYVVSNKKIADTGFVFIGNLKDAVENMIEDFLSRIET